MAGLAADRHERRDRRRRRDRGDRAREDGLGRRATPNVGTEDAGAGARTTVVPRRAPPRPTATVVVAPQPTRSRDRLSTLDWAARGYRLRSRPMPASVSRPAAARAPVEPPCGAIAASAIEPARQTGRRGQDRRHRGVRRRHLASMTKTSTPSSPWRATSLAS
jgi:hypothetical protein